MNSYGVRLRVVEVERAVEANFDVSRTAILDAQIGDSVIYV
jgi:hypothetical protein